MSTRAAQPPDALEHVQRYPAIGEPRRRALFATLVNRFGYECAADVARIVGLADSGALAERPLRDAYVLLGQLRSNGVADALLDRLVRNCRLASTFLSVLAALPTVQHDALVEFVCHCDGDPHSSLAAATHYDRLRGMGFEDEPVKNALYRAKFSVDAALQLLLHRAQ
jgi:hypothetical protein